MNNGKLYVRLHGSPAAGALVLANAKSYTDSQINEIQDLINQAIVNLQNAKEDKSNKSPVINNSSTDIQYPTAKAVNDALLPIRAIIGDEVGNATQFIDNLKEVLLAFENFPDGVDVVELLAAKVNISSIHNALDYIVEGKVLDARQGKVLNDLIILLNTEINLIDTEIALSKTDIVKIKETIKFNNASTLAPFIYRIKNNEALRLGVSSSSSFAGFLIPDITKGAGYQCWQKVLNKFGNTTSTIFMKGVGGARTNELLEGGSSQINAEIMSAETNCRVNNLDAILININYNDGTTITTEQYYKNVKNMLLSVRKLNVVTIIVPPLSYGQYASGYENAALVDACRKAVYRAAWETGTVIIPMEEIMELPNGEVDPQYFFPGDIHPNELGAEKYGIEFAKYFSTDFYVTSVPLKNGTGKFDDPFIRNGYLEFSDRNNNVRTTTNFEVNDEFDGSVIPSILEPAERKFVLRNSGYYSSFKNYLQYRSKDEAGNTGMGNDAYPESYFGRKLRGPNKNNPLRTNVNGGLTFDGTSERIMLIPTKTTVKNRRTPIPGQTDYTVSVLYNNAVRTALGSTADGGIILARYTTSNQFNILIYVQPNEPVLSVAFLNGRYDFPINNDVIGEGATKSGLNLITITSKKGAANTLIYRNGAQVGMLANSNYNTSLVPVNYWNVGARFETQSNPETNIIRRFTGDIHMIDIATSYTNAEEEAYRYGQILAYFNANRLSGAPAKLNNNFVYREIKAATEFEIINASSLTITNWQEDYADNYGNYPNIKVLFLNTDTGKLVMQSGITPELTRVNNLTTEVLLNWNVEQSGVIIIEQQ